MKLSHLLASAWKPLGTTTLCFSVLAACTSTPFTSSGNSTPVPPSRPTASAPADSAAKLLNSHHWLLTEVRDAQGQAQAGWKPTGPEVEGRYVQLDFTNEGMLSVQNLCNQLAGRYTLDGNRMLVEQVVSTMRACSNRPLMELERRVSAQLSQLQRWQLQPGEGSNPPALVLSFQDGSSWQLQGKPTPATLYGSEGVREFLEVAPQRVPCTGVAPMQCLKVRKVHYDDRGLKTDVGAWELFYSNIEGYRHEAGVRNVLRVQRYERKNVPADASRYVYVLDMVVESEIVKQR